MELELRENLLAELRTGGKIQPPLLSAWGRPYLLVWRGKLLGEKDLVVVKWDWHDFEPHSALSVDCQGIR